MSRRERATAGLGVGRSVGIFGTESYAVWIGGELGLGCACVCVTAAAGLLWCFGCTEWGDRERRKKKTHGIRMSRMCIRYIFSCGTNTNDCVDGHGMGERAAALVVCDTGLHWCCVVAHAHFVLNHMRSRVSRRINTAVGILFPNMAQPHEDIAPCFMLL